MANRSGIVEWDGVWTERCSKEGSKKDGRRRMRRKEVEKGLYDKRKGQDEEENVQ
jgi:hypothetical protein